MDAIVSKRRGERRDRKARAAREAREGPEVADRVVSSAAAGMPGCDLVIVSSRRKPGWDRGVAVFTPEKCYRLGEPAEQTIAGRLRYLYPLTEHADFEAIRKKILERRREPASLAREVLAMREKLHAAHPNTSGDFDLKHDRGGMIDSEFTVQYLVLAHAHRHAQLTENLGNIALLGIASDLGLLEKGISEACRNAYREFRRLQHTLRLNGAQYARVPPAQVSAQAGAVRDLWRRVFGDG